MDISLHIPSLSCEDIEGFFNENFENPSECEDVIDNSLDQTNASLTCRIGPRPTNIETNDESSHNSDIDRSTDGVAIPNLSCEEIDRFFDTIGKNKADEGCFPKDVFLFHEYTVKKDGHTNIANVGLDEMIKEYTFSEQIDFDFSLDDLQHSPPSTQTGIEYVRPLGRNEFRSISDSLFIGNVDEKLDINASHRHIDSYLPINERCFEHCFENVSQPHVTYQILNPNRSNTDRPMDTPPPLKYVDQNIGLCLSDRATDHLDHGHVDNSIPIITNSVWVERNLLDGISMSPNCRPDLDESHRPFFNGEKATSFTNTNWVDNSVSYLNKLWWG